MNDICKFFFMTNRYNLISYFLVRTHYQKLILNEFYFNFLNLNNHNRVKIINTLGINFNRIKNSTRLKSN